LEQKINTENDPCCVLINIFLDVNIVGRLLLLCDLKPTPIVGIVVNIAHRPGFADISKKEGRNNDAAVDAVDDVGQPKWYEL
jgi:hypothetical protein